MSSGHPDGAPPRSVSLVKIAAVLIILATLGLLFLQKKQKTWIVACSDTAGEPEHVLAACDQALRWAVRKPAARSLMYRHKMRVYLARNHLGAAVREADLAIEEHPESRVPWQWKAMTLARAKEYPAAMEAIEAALARAPGDDYSLETKAKLLQKMDRLEDVEPLVEAAVAQYEMGSWAWNYAGYFRLKSKEYKSSA
ncbi:hypothetical protein SAMN05444358_104265 [Ruegeria halocynthiae]|uniref:Uncharacterized protein n=1 Tax=Ruegeria halocynthiae TaxID=985054 RepID=A0A1H3AQE7_9RHOB|nr:hypothetical protein [Ruegeria halocynthiae]SDX31825.1 hypothetical protein SAMN05444358_104265 [Ruegeria halocynthiae]